MTFQPIPLCYLYQKSLRTFQGLVVYFSVTTLVSQWVCVNVVKIVSFSLSLTSLASQCYRAGIVAGEQTQKRGLLALLRRAVRTSPLFRPFPVRRRAANIFEGGGGETKTTLFSLAWNRTSRSFTTGQVWTEQCRPLTTKKKKRNFLHHQTLVSSE